jgi:hypothetical protein
MALDPAHGFAKKAETGWNAMPGRSSGWMGKRNQIKSATLPPDLEGAAYDLVEFLEREELGDGEFADGNDELRSQKVDLVVHPGRAISDFVRRRDAVATGGSFSGKTAADCSEINPRPHLFFAHPAELLEPSEESAARGPCERFPEHRLLYSGRLADEHDFAEDSSAGDRRWRHSRATAALAQKGNVLIQLLLFTRCRRHFGQTALTAYGRHKQVTTMLDNDEGAPEIAHPAGYRTALFSKGRRSNPANRASCVMRIQHRSWAG